MDTSSSLFNKHGKHCEISILTSKVQGIEAIIILGINPVSDLIREIDGLLIKIELPNIFENNFKAISLILESCIAQKSKIELVLHIDQIQLFLLLFILIL